jgi:hypothetical protein
VTNIDLDLDICHKLQVLGQYLPGELERWEPIVGFAVSKQQSRQDMAVARFPDNSQGDMDDDFTQAVSKRYPLRS